MFLFDLVAEYRALQALGFSVLIVHLLNNTDLKEKTK